MSRKTLKRITTNTNKKYVLGDVLGEGAFGQVREGMRVDEQEGQFGKRVAVKIITRRLMNKVRNGNENLKREIRCIKLVKHYNVIKLFDVIDEEGNDKVYLVFELANLFSLQDLCEHVKGNPIKDPITDEKENSVPIPYIKILFNQLIEGLQACHSKGVVHRDIKPSNLQLTSDGKLKIIDFGVAETLDRYSALETTEKFAGTPSFQPPEVAQGQRSFSATKVDIWASGVTLYYMVEGSAPFKGDTVDELYSKISEADYKMPQRADNELNDLIENILKKSPDERFTLEQILDHQWLERSETDNIKLTEMLSGLKDRDNDKKKSLMKRFMEEEEDEDDDPPSDNPADDDDGLETERENAIRKRYDWGGNLEADGPLHKQNHELQKAKVESTLAEKCVIC